MSEKLHETKFNPTLIIVREKGKFKVINNRQMTSERIHYLTNKENKLFMAIYVHLVLFELFT